MGWKAQSCSLLYRIGKSKIVDLPPSVGVRVLKSRKVGDNPVDVFFLNQEMDSQNGLGS
jgi:hypothetical protein